MNQLPCCTSAATCDDADSWQGDANIRPADTLTELGHNRQISAAAAEFVVVESAVCNLYYDAL